jgi:hypothetical protein
MWAFAKKCFLIELVPYSAEWQRTWWQTIHMMPGMPVSSNLQWKVNRHDGACVESFQPIGRFEPTFIETHQTSKIISKVRLFKWKIKTHLFLDEIITSSNEVLKDFECYMAVGIRQLGNLTQETAKSNMTV